MFTGPITPQTPEQFKDVCKFTYHKSRWKEIHILRSKEDAVKALPWFNLGVVVMPNRHWFLRLQTDEGGKFTAGGFRKACQTIGVELKFPATERPQQIVMPEKTRTRRLIWDGALPEDMWGREIMLTAIYLANRSPHAALGGQDSVLHTAWEGSGL